ncbi:MAG TPA: rhodanese-like domain-containing protein [Streptosporangiaceae bacterium]|nr:rhodanese-like domain-containing protein [Streptosporangiaceae bacterium]
MSITQVLKKLVSKAYSTIPASEAQSLLVERRAVLIDVRERHEWNTGHVAAAKHIPLGSLSGRMGEIPAGRPVITICQSGMRSARAAGLLAKQGHEVYNLRGGMSAWVATGLPVKGGGYR